MAKALLAAARGNHINIVKYILEKDVSVMEQEIREGIPLIKQAMADDLSCVFEVNRYIYNLNEIHKTTSSDYTFLNRL